MRAYATACFEGVGSRSAYSKGSSKFTDLSIVFLNMLCVMTALCENTSCA
jgi:hypothetical protein